MRKPTFAEAMAFSRHIITFGGGIMVGAVSLGLATPDQASATTDALNLLAHGVGEVGAALATLAATAMALWAAITASPIAQIFAASKSGAVTKIEVNDPSVVSAVPSDKVIVGKAP